MTTGSHVTYRYLYNGEAAKAIFVRSMSVVTGLYRFPDGSVHERHHSSFIW